MERTDAGQICSRIVTIVQRDTPLVEAAQLMRSQHVGSLVVVDETSQGRLVCGILTDRDIVTAVVASEVDPATLTVEDVMTTDVVTALETDSVTDLVRTMRRRGVRRLPVTTAQRVLVGLVALDDVLSLLAEQLRAMALAIETEQLQERRARR
jgi:signal-transduction protein with cAMP-binding, CBS, and nucleotidyltransferase domain